MVFCFVVATWAMASMATMEEDEKECADQLANLAACIPFVSGTAKKPTPVLPRCTETVLNLPPDSPDAKIFKEADQGSTSSSTANSPSTSASTSSGSPSSSSSSSSSAGTCSNSISKAKPSSNNGAKVKVFLGGNCLVLMASIAWIFM
ncbi:hypothetical protein CRYUN_Cryun33cG0048800 [Craigia yunnanensis]